MTDRQKALLERLRRLLADSAELSEKRMFGGVCLMRGEHMLCCVGSKGLLLRVGTEREPALLALPGTEPMSHGGRRMSGFVWADERTLDDEAVSRWLAEADAYVAVLPPKAAKRARRG